MGNKLNQGHDFGLKAKANGSTKAEAMVHKAKVWDPQGQSH